jgi:hypothetical protein
MTERATSEDVAAVRDSLLAWRAAGEADPKIAVDGGMGIGMAVFGLNDLDQVVRIHGASVEDTVSVSEGGGVETDRTAATDG